VDDAAGAAVQLLEWPTGAVNTCDDAPAAAREWVTVWAPAYPSWREGFAAL
jgi:hypothetical protein